MHKEIAFAVWFSLPVKHLLMIARTYCQFPFHLNVTCWVRKCTVSFCLWKGPTTLKRSRLVCSYSLCANISQIHFLCAHFHATCNVQTEVKLVVNWWTRASADSAETITFTSENDCAMKQNVNYLLTATGVSCLMTNEIYVLVGLGCGFISAYHWIWSSLFYTSIKVHTVALLWYYACLLPIIDEDAFAVLVCSVDSLNNQLVWTIWRISSLYNRFIISFLVIVAQRVPCRH